MIKKKVKLLSFLFVLSLGFIACNDDDDVPDNGAVVKVKVRYDDGDKARNEIVYMFKDTQPTNDTPASQAVRSAITDSDGEAKFTLNFTDLDIFDNETKLYFVVYYTHPTTGVSYLGGGEEVTVTRNETKTITIHLLYD